MKKLVTRCCLCGKVCETPLGNNPAPFFSDDKKAGCCNECDLEIVIPERLRMAAASLDTVTDVVPKRKYKPVNYRENLTEFRDRSGLSQKQIAELLHISKSSWKKYEYGQRTPRKGLRKNIEALMAQYEGQKGGIA